MTRTIDSNTGRQIAAFAMAHLAGTPYLHQGRVYGPQGGIDCFGILIAIAKRFGFEHKDYLDYSRDVDGSQIEERLEEYCDRVDQKDSRDGDILLFWIETPENPQHFGVVCGKGRYFLHARERMGGPSRVSTCPMTGRVGKVWVDRTCSVWRYRGKV